MPIYCYKCVDGHVTEDFTHYPEPRSTVNCDICGKPADRDFASECFNTDLVDNERYSESMGVVPNQIPQAMRTFPGSEYDSEGRLLIKNRKHKLLEMKRRGYVEFN